MTPEGVNVRHADRDWIGGEWVGAQSGRTIDLVCPNTEEVIGAVTAASITSASAPGALSRHMSESRS